jgi:hypothetical protein
VVATPEFKQNAFYFDLDDNVESEYQTLFNPEVLQPQIIDKTELNWKTVERFLKPGP